MKSPKVGKTVRRFNPRRSLNAETQAIRTIEKLADAGALKPGGFFDRGVIEQIQQDYIIAKDQDATWDFDKEEWVPETGEQLSPLAAVLGEDVDTVFKARRWYDTTPRFRKYMLLYGVKGDPDTHRPLTTWIGKEMIETARSTGKPLASLLRKSLSDRLRRLLGAGNFGVWLNVEASSKATYALHAHGLLYVKDRRYLIHPSDERDALIRELRLGSGDDLSLKAKEREIGASNWTRITRKDLNVGWIEYCRKARRDRRFRVSAKEPPADIGARLEAGTYNLTGQASDFYGRARIMVSGLANDTVESWSNEDWSRVTGDDGALH